MMPGTGGSDPVKTTCLRFFHALTAKNDTTAARSSRARVAPTLTPAVPPFERPCELTGPAADSELDGGVASVASDEVVGPAEAMDVVGTSKLPGFLDVVEVVGPAEAMDVVGASKLPGFLDVVEVLELVEVLGVGAVVCVVCDLLNAAALLGLLESFAATRSSAGHPIRSQAFEEQHPKKGLFKSKQVYHSPVGSWHS
ncbi:hypothetical protein KVR01_005122 [Diaporthe batatas]|uniref:uncharacterized protein n=1 Tax=Diaporthe batatas TaxID=748121 RepID=UPI001D04C421|nr:uncharacterized protein KVR01_005122 [Diaporthe batatas]KAG8164847.1 hypothetical protein KVR01_005122 [Diaporthe batatas]